MEAPQAPVPDDKDWTFVLQRSCPECGYTAAGVDATLLPSLIRTATSPWAEVLARPDVAVRPADQVWSPLEYACHVRDVLAVFSERIELVRSEDNPTFTNWDQDATAITQRYWAEDPVVVAVQIEAAADHNAKLWAEVGEHEWQRPATRSNGSKFTLETLGTYELHDLIHHLHDVGVL